MSKNQVSAQKEGNVIEVKIIATSEEMAERMSKNQVSVRKEGNVIEVKIIAASEEMADKFFDIIELFVTTAFRVDLEKEWRQRGED